MNYGSSFVSSHLMVSDMHTCIGTRTCTHMLAYTHATCIHTLTYVYMHTHMHDEAETCP